MARGYFVISDISGYTQFLTQSELEHAKGILEALFKAIIARIEAPLAISNFQGDAILCYAPEWRLWRPLQLTLAERPVQQSQRSTPSLRIV